MGGLLGFCLPLIRLLLKLVNIVVLNPQNK